ncbi:hypothetical protein H072_6807 [Dactylellina haptotyla CBS 200.50]|uniref:Tryptophan synthase beta chain-like PALP domain-containing protein n=1 Tax=Dactylellina haptotyla (strain CBS 200.50) TaxID=1284197 RepID=S8BVU0_DACHA|nr:hypothetical protein H072_6807 [Dactylellina haptotyla CBS 200.50]
MKFSILSLIVLAPLALASPLEKRSCPTSAEIACSNVCKSQASSYCNSTCGGNPSCSSSCYSTKGATHAISRLLPEQASKGVITHSSGNHAQALSIAAASHNPPIPCTVIMPEISTPSKIAATKGYGANVVFSGSTAPEREAKVAEEQAKTGAVLIPPYDHPWILIGQGTVAVELIAQAEAAGRPLDAIIAPCGGGGLLSGIATACEGTGIKVFGAEPRKDGANDCQRGLKAGKRVEVVKTLTVADGLRTPTGKITYGIIEKKVAGVFSVTEWEILQTVRLVLERLKVVVEPSSVVPLAVALFDEEFRRIVEREGGKKGWNVGVVFSGGNTTVEMLGKLFAREEEFSGEQEEACKNVYRCP